MDLLHFYLDDPSLLGWRLSDGASLGDAVSELARQWPAPHENLLAHRGEWPLGWLDLPQGGPWVAECGQLAASLSQSCDTLVVCGIGGSALGTQAVYVALDHPLACLKPVLVLDNVDPTQIATLLELADLQRSALNVISKSGETLETMAGFAFLLGKLDAMGMDEAGIASRVVATTDPSKGLLREMAVARGWQTLPVPRNVGGRFSVLSAVGLFPLAFAGVDIQGLLDGARVCQNWLAGLPTADNPAWRLAAMHFLAHTRGGCTVAVQYIFGDPLVLLGDWWRQLWAESLAKARRTDGSPSGIGQTPLVARGTTDQHSQNQLYFEGPPDKLYGFLTCEQWSSDETVAPPAGVLPEALRYIEGRSFGQVLRACHEGTRDALREAGRPVYEVRLPRPGAQELGAYLQFWMLAAAYAGLLYGVNPFDQPGVEHSKKLTRGRLG